MVRWRLVSALALVALLPGGPAWAADFPTGTFTASKQPDWSITFGEKGRFTVTRGGKAVVEGSYKVAGAEVTLTDEAGQFATPDPAGKTGKYRWKHTDGKLTFTVVEDKSRGRELLLTLNDWAQKKK